MKKLIISIFIFVLYNCETNKKNTAIKAFNTEFVKKTYQSEGQLIYEDFCVSCHLPNGKGVPKAFPPLANSDFLKENQDLSIKAVKYGMTGEILVNGVTYNSAMAPLGLSNKEVADVMNYINTAWGNNIENVITEAYVSKIRP